MIEEQVIVEDQPQQEPQGPQDPPTKRRALYDAVSKDYDLGTFEDFDKKLNDPAKLRAFYDGVGKEYQLGSFEEFQQKVSPVKKKVGSINFDLSSTNIPSDLEAQSTLPGGKQEVQTIELFETSDGDKIPTSDVVSLLNKSAQLREPTVPVVSGSTGGAGVSMKTDPEREKEADKIKELVRSKGFDPDKIYEDYRDVSPDQARVPGFRPEDKAGNPQLYERKIAAAAWQPNLRSAVNDAINEGDITAEKAAEIDQLFNDAKTPGMSYGYRRQITAKLADAINTYVKDEDKKERLLKKLAIDRSVSYGIEDPAKISEVTQTTESKYLDPDQALAYQFLSDTNPEMAKGYNILFIDPEKVKADESNAGVGYQYKASRLKQIGLQLRQNAIQEQLNDLGNISAKRELTPEETAKAQTLMSEAERVAGEYKAMDVKYPAVKKYNDVQMLQDIMGNASIEDEGRLLGGPMWLATKLSRGFEETGGSLVDILGEPFRNPEASKLHQLDVLGEKMMFDTLLQVPQSDKVLQDYEIHIEPEIKKQIESIKANPNLSFKEKNKQVYDLMQAHPDAFQRAPIKGAKLNINPASAFYSLGDLAASVAPYVVLETATGGGATAGLARKFISSFNAAALTSFRSAYADAIDKGEANPMAYAMRNVAINAAAMAGAQTPAMVKKLLGTESAVGSIVSKMDDKAIQAVLEKPDSRLIRLGKAFGSKVGEGLKGGAKFEAAMLPAKLINKKLNKEEIDPEELVKESAVMIMSMGALGMGGVPVKYKELTELDKGSILKAAEDPEAHKASALKMYQEGNISREQYEQSVKNIDLAQKAAETTKFMDNDGNPLPERKKAELLAAKIQEAKLKEQSTEPEEEVTRNGVTIQPPMEIPEPITVGGETAPEESTSIKNAVTAKERRLRGLEEIEVQARRTFPEVFDKGKAMVESGEIDPIALAKEVIQKNRPLKAEESVALLYDRMRLSNEYEKTVDEINEAHSKGEDIKAGILESKLKDIEDLINLNDKAARLTGYEGGLGLAIRRLMIKKDYSLLNVLSEFKAANKGEELPEELKTKLEDLTQRLKAAEMKLEEYEKKLNDLRAQKSISGIRKSKKTKEQFKQERSKIKDSIKSKWESFKKPGIVAQNKDLLIELAPDVAQLVKSYAEEGITKLEEIIEKVYNDIIDNGIEGVSQKDVSDMIAGVYKKEKGAIEIDRDHMELRANVEKVKKQIDALKEKVRLENRTKLEKRLDFFHKWRRFALLSGVKVLGKIGVAAGARSFLTSPLEAAISSATSKIPGLSKIAKGATREGAGFNPKAEAKALRQWVEKATYQDIREIMKSGKGQLDYLYGDKLYPPPDWTEFFGQLHSAIKSIPKRAEYFRSFEIRAEKAAKEGKDLTDPLVQQEIGLAAYNDALRSIFMQDNYVTDSYKSIIRTLEKSEIPGSGMASNLLKFFFPIVKVPTNFVAESTSYMVGGIKAAFALRKGISELTPQQKDYIMRNFNKQTIGLAFIMLGYFNPQAVGGYYSGKRDENDLAAGDLTLFGVHLPHWMSHTPLLECLQLGSTLRRAKDSQIEKTGSGNIMAGLPTALSGIKNQVPFFGQGNQIGAALKSKDGVEKFLFRTAQSVVDPQLIREIAEVTDDEGETVKKDPQTFLDHLKTGIPGLRREVPNKQPAESNKKAKKDAKEKKP